MTVRTAARSFAGKVLHAMRAPFLYIVLPLFVFGVILPCAAVIVQSLFQPQ